MKVAIVIEFRPGLDSKCHTLTRHIQAIVKFQYKDCPVSIQCICNMHYSFWDEGSPHSIDNSMELLLF